MDHSVHQMICMSTSFDSNNENYTCATSLLYDREGKRKYLTQKERRAFLEEAKRHSSSKEWTFCLVLAYTGARISEVLALTAKQIDFDTSTIIVRCLKKRRDGVFRAVPVPEDVIQELERVHDIGERQQEGSSGRLWPWCRTSAWSHVKTRLNAANISGPQATPKGLRHGMAVSALQSGVPINIVKRWLGHARLSTTAIYADAIGEEERSIAEGMWARF